MDLGQLVDRGRIARRPSWPGGWQQAEIPRWSWWWWSSAALAVSRLSLPVATGVPARFGRHPRVLALDEGEHRRQGWGHLAGRCTGRRGIAAGRLDLHGGRRGWMGLRETAGSEPHSGARCSCRSARPRPPRRGCGRRRRRCRCRPVPARPLAGSARRPAPIRGGTAPHPAQSSPCSRASPPAPRRRETCDHAQGTREDQDQGQGHDPTTSTREPASLARRSHRSDSLGTRMAGDERSTCRRGRGPRLGNVQCSRVRMNSHQERCETRTQGHAGIRPAVGPSGPMRLGPFRLRRAGTRGRRGSGSGSGGCRR